MTLHEFQCFEFSLAEEELHLCCSWLWITMCIFGCGDITKHSPSIGASFYLEPRPARIRFSMSWPFVALRWRSWVHRCRRSPLCQLGTWNFQGLFVVALDCIKVKGVHLPEPGSGRAWPCSGHLSIYDPTWLQEVFTLIVLLLRFWGSQVCISI